MASTRIEYARRVMAALEIPDSYSHIGCRRALCAWMHAESGEHPGLCNGVFEQGAAWNPLNTTLKEPGSTYYNVLSSSIGVQNYPTEALGVDAVVRTLRGDPRYAGVLYALAKSYVTAQQIMNAIAASPWGTPGWLLSAALAAYQANRGFYNFYPVGI